MISILTRETPMPLPHGSIHPKHMTDLSAPSLSQHKGDLA